MSSTVGRRGLALIQDFVSRPQVWFNLGCRGGISGNPQSIGLGLGFMGPGGQQTISTFIGGIKTLLPGAAKDMGQGFNSVFGIERLGSGAGPVQLSQVRGFIQLRTNLEVADNSGARRVQCIKVMKGSNAAKIGDIIMASVKDAQPRGKVKKGEVVTCVVVRAATQKLRRDGSEIKFDKNAVVLINKQGEPIGTRIFGPVPHELRRRKLVKILTLAEYVA